MLPWNPLNLLLKRKMEEIKGIISKEENAVPDFVNVSDKLAGVIDKLLSKENATLSANVKNTIGPLKETYGKLELLGLIKTDVPKINRETIATLREIYGNALENYPTISGRIQLLYAMLVQE